MYPNIDSCEIPQLYQVQCLENMGNFGDQLVKRQEERKAKKIVKKAEEETSAPDEETTSQED